MNQVIENIKKRRTTRAYKEDQIKREELEAILEAGIWAPSGHNRQPWHFTVIQNQEIIDKINKDVKEAAKVTKVEDIRKMMENEKFHIFYGAPTVVLVSYDEKNGLTALEDISAATQNILLAAESLGIGSCWNGIVTMGLAYNKELEKSITEELNIPENHKISHAIALGYAKTEILRGPKRKEDTVTYIR